MMTKSFVQSGLFQGIILGFFILLYLQQFHSLNIYENVLNHTIFSFQDGNRFETDTDTMMDIFSEHYDHSLRPHSVYRRLGMKYDSKTQLRTMDTKHIVQMLHKWITVDYLKFHKQNRYNGTRYLIFSPVETGIGDRTDYLSYSYLLAVLTNRIFIIDWDSPAPLQDFLSNANHGTNLFFDPDKDTQRNISARKFDHPDVYYMQGNMTSFSTDEEKLSSNTFVVVSKNQKQPSRLSDSLLSKFKPESTSLNELRLIMRFEALRRSIFHDVLRLNPAILKRQNNFIQTLNERHSQDLRPCGHPVGSRYISVHARLGVGVGEGLARFTDISRYQRKAAKCLASRAIRAVALTQGKAKSIFLATDTPEFRDLFIKTVSVFSNNGVKVVTGNNPVKHSNKLKNLKEKPSSTERDVLDASYVDLVTLGCGTHIISLYSSFPRLALYLGSAETLTEIRNEICLHEEQWTDTI